VAGADFIRADLHVHTFPDGDPDPAPDVDTYVKAALASGVRVLGITDHNTDRFAAGAIKAAQGTGLFVAPGAEVSTHDGHLLALFAPDALTELEAFVNPTNLKLTAISQTEQRSTRAVLDLVDEIYRRGGLAISAHADAADGIHERLKPAELTELLASPAVAGLEFLHKEALEIWFTDQDGDPHRLAAWKARQSIPELRDRGLAHLMSSDAHSIDKVGQDRSARTLTRLRLDDLNIEALRLAVQLNPKARCEYVAGKIASNRAFWFACHGGQQHAAEYLLDHGADVNWLPSWGERTPLDAALRSEANGLAVWLRGRGGTSAGEVG
jgi:PHP family Zn ribbon phosphoesterase